MLFKLITTLNVTQNTALSVLICRNNNLSSLDVSQNTSLAVLHCFNNQLTSLDVTKNTSLSGLYCYNNQITNLDLTQCTGLGVLSCSDNQLTNLDLTQNTLLSNLVCSDNQLTELNISQNPGITNLGCNNNQITSLDVSHLLGLINLYCNDNLLTNLTMGQNTSLTTFYCFNNQLSNLDVSQCTAITTLFCHLNQLTSIDVSQHTSLLYLRCYNNQLTTLDVKNGTNSQIVIFDTQNNATLECIQVDDETAANASQAPYTNWLKDATATYAEDCNTTAIEDANFEQALIDLGYITDGSVDGIVTTSEISTITTLDVSSQNISDLTGIEAFTSLTTLIVSNNQLITLILTSGDEGRTTDAAVSAPNNNLLNIVIRLTELVTIDISNVPNLESLDAQGSKLIALDVSNNNNLTVLDITNNPLTCAQVNQTQLDNIPSGWVKDTTATYSTNCEALGLDDVLLAKSITLYPNPVSEILIIDSTIPLTKVEVFSLLGQKVKDINSDFNSINVSNLSKGVYIVRLQSENGFTTKKLIKK